MTGPNAPLLSAILIVKNEEANLPRCLTSLRGVADEIVVVDTGSSDGTVEIARGAGAVVAFFPWNGNEADARNVSVRAAAGRWLLMIDADEVVSAELAAEVRPVLEKLDGQTAINSLSVHFRNHHGEHGETSLTRMLRIGRNRAGYAFAGAIHATCNYAQQVHALAGHIDHYGYQWTDEIRLRKSAHMIAHLTPLCAGDHPPLKPLCELMTFLLIAGDEAAFARRWQQALAHPQAERTRGPESVHWLVNLANILPAFAQQNDFVTGRAEAEAVVQAHPSHVAARFYLLQAAVLERQWALVEEHASALLSSDLQVSELHQIIHPEKQLVPARAWLWLARIHLNKMDEPTLPAELEHARLAHILLAAQAAFDGPLTSTNPALASALAMIWSLQEKAPRSPEQRLPLLNKLNRARDGHPVGSLPHLLAALTRAALCEETRQIPALIAELKALAEDYPSLPWLIAGLGKLSASQTFSLEIFADTFLHLA